MTMMLSARLRGPRGIIGSLAALLLAACTGATEVPPTPAGEAVEVQLKSYSVTPNPATVKAGGVNFNAYNGAPDLVHKLVVVKSDLAVDQLPIGSGGTVDETAVTVVGKVEDLEVGKTGTLSANVAAGQYILLCNRPGHYQAGMRTAFVVTP